MSTVKCQLCAQNTHLANNCSYLCTPCKYFGCNGFRNLKISNSDRNPGRKFLRRQTPNCSHFQWLDEDMLESKGKAPSSSSTSRASTSLTKVISSTTGCFICGDNNHWMQNFQWKSSPCIKEGCPGTRQVKTAGPKTTNAGKKFLKCQTCDGFQWLSEAMEAPCSQTKNYNYRS